MKNAIYVRILQPRKTAMQSGKGKQKSWKLEFEAARPSLPDQLMGWPSSSDTRKNMALAFPSQAAALSYAKHHGYIYTLIKPYALTERSVAYGDNFLASRRSPWTH